MNKVKRLILETPYMNNYTSLSHEMIKLYWYVVREPIIEDARDNVFNVVYNG